MPDITATLEVFETEVLFWAERRAIYAETHTTDGVMQYDMIKIMYMLYDYTEDAAWLTHAATAFDAFMRYAGPNNGAIQTKNMCCEGPRMHWKRAGSTVARDIITAQTYNMGFGVNANVFTTDPYFTNSDGRWTALGAPAPAHNAGILNIRDIVMPAWVCMLNLQEGLSTQVAADEAYVTQATNLVFDFFERSFIDETIWYNRPFMIALAAQYLIWWEERYGTDARVLTYIKAACDYLDTLWIPRGTTGNLQQVGGVFAPLKEDCGSWYYTDRNHNPTLDPSNIQGGDRDSDAASLNMGILPMYAYVYWRDPTHPVAYKDRADEAFISSFNTFGWTAPDGPDHDPHTWRNAYGEWYYEENKVMLETLRWVFDYFKWRNLEPRTYSATSWGPGMPSNPLVDYTLTVTKSGTGAGVVSSAPSGITCGGTCTEDYEDGTVVTLTAAPNVGSTFTSWSGGDGAVSGSGEAAPADVNLTTAGLQDWAHWGLSVVGDYNHKASAISDRANVGSGTPVRYTGAANKFTWTNGTPTATATLADAGVAVAGLNNGFSFTVPSLVTEQRLTVYVGVYRGTGTLTATLNDTVASSYQGTVTNNSGVTNAEFEIYFRSGSAGKTLTITWTFTADAGGGDVNIRAATLNTGDIPLSAAVTMSGDKTVNAVFTTIASPPPAGPTPPVRGNQKTLLQAESTELWKDEVRLAFGGTVVGRAVTTDDTPSTLLTIPLNTGRTSFLQAHIVASRTGGSAGTDGDGASYELRATYKNVAGTITLLGSVTTPYSAESQAAWDATLTISGTNVLVRVTGAANNTVAWVAKTYVDEVSN